MARLQDELSDEYVKEKADDILRSMMDAVDHLRTYEYSGREISKMYDIETDYWYIFTNHNYFVYRIEPEKIIVVQMFHEREDFMKTLFGISGRTQESIDYWGEQGDDSNEQLCSDQQTDKKTAKRVS